MTRPARSAVPLALTGATPESVAYSRPERRVPPRARVVAGKRAWRGLPRTHGEAAAVDGSTAWPYQWASLARSPSRRWRYAYSHATYVAGSLHDVIRARRTPRRPCHIEFAPRRQFRGVPVVFQRSLEPPRTARLECNLTTCIVLFGRGRPNATSDDSSGHHGSRHQTVVSAGQRARHRGHVVPAGAPGGTGGVGWMRRGQRSIWPEPVTPPARFSASSCAASKGVAATQPVNTERYAAKSMT